MASGFWRLLIDPKKNRLAALHKKAVERRLRNFGLRYDDLYDPLYDLDIKEALNRLPKEVVEARNQRLKRALDLSLKHKYLDPELQDDQSREEDDLTLQLTKSTTNELIPVVHEIGVLEQLATNNNREAMQIIQQILGTLPRAILRAQIMHGIVPPPPVDVKDVMDPFFYTQPQIPHALHSPPGLPWRSIFNKRSS